jgi:hypothetical protein
MEREKELAKLVNVLRRTARMAMHSHWTGTAEDTAAYCVEQYNRVLARLKELDATVGTIFAPLAPGSSLTVAAMACRQLAAYYEDEVAAPKGWGEWGGVWADPRFGVWIDKRAFKEFWSRSARDLEDFGEYIRQNIEDWFRQHKSKEDPKSETESK